MTNLSADSQLRFTIANFGPSADRAEIALDTGSSSKKIVFRDYFSNTTLLALVGSSANVGMGTDAPGTRLEVRAAKGDSDYPLYVNNDSGHGSIRLRRTQELSNGAGVGVIDFAGNVNGVGQGFAQVKVEAADITAGSEDGRIILRTMKAGAMIDALTVLSGEVGIGTTTPTAALDVRGAVIAGTVKKIRILEDEIISATDNDLKIDAFGAKNIILQGSSNGSVGVGTSTPLALLDARGTIGLSQEVAGSPFLRTKFSVESAEPTLGLPAVTILVRRKQPSDAGHGFLKVMNDENSESDGRGLILCAGTAKSTGAYRGRPGALILQSANATVNALIADNNGRLRLLRGDGAPETQHILIDSQPLLEDDFWRLDADVWATEATGNGSVEPSSETTPVDLTRGGLLKVRTDAEFATNYAALLAQRPLVHSRGARFRCRFYVKTPHGTNNKLAVELGIKSPGGWSILGGSGYYISFNPPKWGSTDMWLVADNGLLPPQSAALTNGGLVQDKFYEAELTTKMVGDTCVVKGWFQNAYLETSFVVAAADSPLFANLVPGFAVYNLEKKEQLLYVDMIEYDSVRAGEG